MDIVLQNGYDTSRPKGEKKKNLKMDGGKTKE